MKTNLKTLSCNLVCKCHKLFPKSWLIEKDDEPDIIKYSCRMTGLSCEVEDNKNE